MEVLRFKFWIATLFNNPRIIADDVFIFMYIFYSSFNSIYFTHRRINQTISSIHGPYACHILTLKCDKV